MAKPIRIEYNGAVYHITTRVNTRRPIFKDDTDRLLFLNTLEQVNKRYNWHCHAYCLMKNHYFLVIETPDGNLSMGMKHLNGVYAQAYNRRHNRVGHVFQGRYKAILIQKEGHLLEVCRYVVLHPVRAKRVGIPEEWNWSSYRATTGGGVLHPCLGTDWVLGQFSRRRSEARKRYREFVEAGIEEDLWKKVRGESLLGEEGFADTLLDYIKRYRDMQEIPRQQRYIDRPLLKNLFTDNVVSDKKQRIAQIALAHIEHGYTLKEIANHLGIHYTTVSKYVKKRSEKK